MDAAFTLAWQYAAHQVRSEDLPMAAARLLAGDHDSPALRELAGCSGRERWSDLDPMIRQALDELGHPVPSGAAAERHLVHHLAGRLAADELTPSEVYAELGTHTTGDLATKAEEQLIGVVARAACCRSCFSEFEEFSPGEFRTWEADVRSAAAALLTSGDDPSVT
ncbi:hypothetical protein [Kitasatospora sp. NPDC002040]|uniref:hypothetical protein n=1 Tax=Kitasatospora sp. NPDC002040 TaxID=3154661 RepID=UPI0033200BAA